MIRHFLLRDFRTYRMFWIILAILTGCAVVAMLLSSSLIPLLLLGYAYLLFGLLPLQSLTGVRFRSQHIMSRNYLLSLPVKREYLFLIIQFRNLIFWVPLILLLLSVPFLPLGDDSPFGVPKNWYGLYCIGVLSCLVWMTNGSIQAQLSIEKIMAYVTQKKRALAWLKTLGVYLVEVLLLIALSAGFLSLGTFYDVIFVTLAVGLAWTRFYFARKSWLHHQ